MTYLALFGHFELDCSNRSWLPWTISHHPAPSVHSESFLRPCGTETAVAMTTNTTPATATPMTTITIPKFDIINLPALDPLPQ